MITWLDLLIGLLPFALIALLLWMRLRAVGVSPEATLKFIAKVFALVVIAIVGLMCTARSWRAGNSWLMAVGTIVTVGSILLLRRNLRAIWENFPLPSNESNQNDESV
ncbi:hypothetical protein GG496_002375 [Candidatus Fervidibacteria bacterium JGI MDM2 JNZ-1-D12]